MSMGLVTRAMEMDQKVDPVEEVMNDVMRYLPGIQINGIDILWVAFQRVGQTAKGVWVPDTVKKEDGIQGLVGLIVKKGPVIDVSPEMHERFGGADKVPRVGQWAVIDTRYGVRFMLGERYARITEAKLIYALIERPDWII